MSSLSSYLCPNSDNVAAPARHASRPMEPAKGMHMDMEHSKRAYAPPSPAGADMPRVVYVTETRTDCTCKSTPAPFHPMHVSQIPVDVPMSSMATMPAMSSMGYSHGVMYAAPSSSALYGSYSRSQMSARPTPSGASPNRFNTFEGAAPKASAVQSGIAAIGIAAVMGLMVAL